jgi:shikimate kinase
MAPETPDVIALVGLRCSGKTSAGRILADRLGRAFVDLDDEIAARAGLGSAGEVIERLGLERFRELERQALARSLERGEPIVLATGGGAVEDRVNRRRLRTRTRCAWLRADPATLRARMAADPTPRPGLLGPDPLAEIEQLAAARESLYAEVAHLTLDTSAADPRAVATRLADEL